MNWPYVLKGEYMWLNPMIVFNSSSSMFEKKKKFIQRLKFCRYLYHPVWVTISGLHALSRWHFPNPNGRVSWTTNNSVQFITVINWEHYGKQRLIFVKNNLPKSLQETGRVGWGRDCKQWLHVCPGWSQHIKPWNSILLRSNCSEPEYKKIICHDLNCI